MSLTPRITLDEEFLSGLKCAVCESSELKIVHVEKYPDFVSCNQCGSAFVVESEGSWVMYGKIPQEYPQTIQFALKQWTWLDAVAQRAADEREQSSAPMFITEPPPPIVEDTPPEPTASAPPVIEDTPPEPTTSAPPVVEDTPPEPTDSSATIIEDTPPEPTSSSPPFVEEAPTPSMEELYPEEPTPAPEDASVEMAQKPPFPDEVIILGDGSSDISALEEATPSFMEPDPGPEEVIVPAPFEPIEAPEIIDFEESISMSAEEVQHSEAAAIEDITEQVIDENPEIFGLPPIDTAVEPAVIEKPEAAAPPAAVTQAELATEPPPGEAKNTVRSPLEQKDKSLSVPVGEPEPDKRFQITIRGSGPKYPKNYCAHCLRTPVKLKTIMRGSLPDPKQPGKRKMVPLELPFCKDCQKRMDARGQDENNARILAFLVSAIVALVAIIAPLLFGIVDFQTNAFLSVIVLLVLAVLGFSIPLLLLLSRASNFPPPRDAAFVLSTLLVHESGPDLTEFEWRNHGYAELFRQVNIENVNGNLETVADRATFTEVQPEETPGELKEEPEQVAVEENSEEESPTS